MHIQFEELGIVKGIIAKHVPDRIVWAFGSRVHGHNLKPFSDLDLVILGEQSVGIECYAALKHDFSQSDLPFRVDIVEWYGLEKNFKELIKREYEVVQFSHSKP